MALGAGFLRTTLRPRNPVPLRQPFELLRAEVCISRFRQVQTLLTHNEFAGGTPFFCRCSCPVVFAPRPSANSIRTKRVRRRRVLSTPFVLKPIDGSEAMARALAPAR